MAKSHSWDQKGTIGHKSLHSLKVLCISCKIINIPTSIPPNDLFKTVNFLKKVLMSTKRPSPPSPHGRESLFL